MKTIIVWITTCCLLTTSLKADEPIFYNVEESYNSNLDEPIFSDNPKSEEKILSQDETPYDEKTNNDNCAGAGYFDCRRGYCLITGVVIGTALFVGMVALIINESDHAHHCH